MALAGDRYQLKQESNNDVFVMFEFRAISVRPLERQWISLVQLDEVNI